MDSFRQDAQRYRKLMALVEFGEYGIEVAASGVLSGVWIDDKRDLDARLDARPAPSKEDSYK